MPKRTPSTNTDPVADLFQAILDLTYLDLRTVCDALALSENGEEGARTCGDWMELLIETAESQLAEPLEQED